MGLNTNAVRFLLTGKSLGVDFGDTVMIGRQRLFATPHELKTVLDAHGHPVTLSEAEEIATASHEYAEPLLKRLGAREVRSIDSSGWERATDIHDMNLPIPDELRARFTTVLESGTLEHIFDFPRSIRNCMDMVVEGGHFLGITPCNNFLGHGFYQFSPDLFFRLFSEDNGFEVVKMFLYEDSPTVDWYEVVDPQGVEQWWTDERHVHSSEPAYLATIARRTSGMPGAFSTPNQSKYQALWTYLEQRGEDIFSLEANPERAPAVQVERRGMLFKVLRAGLSCARWFFRRFGYEISRHGYHRKLFKRLPPAVRPSQQ